ncbi:ABC transporter ATP-binding protein [Jeotgalibacillus proteolyticus]|uniref:ABC transporter ATP-binding protein n=1 Tax=Jeotgalibacillus proteolyticus TaxID=2082395 RepID=A0A2S5GDN6_9BACL|nr:ATP-binding cassette domain-containing protein [Jeotgalibacillus proteolyticus]PPA71099.1 ABC transporter ATP-binding protein [Jeotgalibacillus proteolyticus]
MSDTVLTVQGLQKSFKNQQVLHDVSFTVKKGEITALLGPNGAGKSTTIRSIMGILYPDQGAIHFTGEKEGQIPKHKIGYLPEERGLYKNVKIMDILLYFAELKDYPLKKAKERALSYLKKFGLEGKDKVSIEELSKGMGQKVQFIASIIHEPELLILDEPFSGLDPVSQEVFKEEIRLLAKNGTAILLSAHQMNLVEEMADRLIMLHKGKEVISGTMDEVKKRYASFKCTINGQNDKQQLLSIPGVTRVEQREHISVLFLNQDLNPTEWIRSLPSTIHIEEFRLDRISLHEIFIDVASDRTLSAEEEKSYA